MSHYTTLAIVRKNSASSFEDIMAPYDENLDVEPYIFQTKEELIKEFAADVEKRRRSHKRALELTKEEYEEAREKEDLFYRSYTVARGPMPEGYEELNLDDPEAVYALYRKEEGEYDDFDEEGNLLSTYNPNSKWDWYITGGRWSDQLILKNGKRADRAMAGDVDWDAMFAVTPEEAKKWSDFWDEYVLGTLPPEIAAFDEKGQTDYLRGKYGFTFYRPEFYLENYRTKEEYIRRQGLWNTYAVVDEKGWNEPGEMWWWGLSNATAESKRDWDDNYRARFIDTLDPEDEIQIFDCHI